jgi:hypothetical protein
VTTIVLFSFISPLFFVYIIPADEKCGLYVSVIITKMVLGYNFFPAATVKVGYGGKVKALHGSKPIF